MVENVTFGSGVIRIAVNKGNIGEMNGGACGSSAELGVRRLRVRNATAVPGAGRTKRSWRSARGVIVPQMSWGIWLFRREDAAQSQTVIASQKTPATAAVVAVHGTANNWRGRSQGASLSHNTCGTCCAHTCAGTRKSAECTIFEITGHDRWPCN